MNDCGLVPKNEEYTTCRVDQWPFSPAILVLQRIESPMVSRAKCIFLAQHFDGVHFLSRCWVYLVLNVYLTIGGDAPGKQEAEHDWISRHLNDIQQSYRNGQLPKQETQLHPP